MPKMLEMIQQSAVPANLMRTAARGALALPASEMLEILVYLTTHPLFGEEARMTLAGWDVASAVNVCSDPHVAGAIISYFLNPKNWRPPILTALVNNPALDEPQLMDLAAAANREVAGIMISSELVLKHKWVLKQLFANPKIAGSAEYAKLLHILAPAQEPAAAPAEPAPEAGPGDDTETALKAFQEKHAADIQAEEGKKFELVKSESSDEPDDLAELVKAVEEPKLAPKKEEPERLSVIQKVNRMTVGERVQLAVKGTKDERFVLIRDGSKVVSLAVLESPKLSDAEMETFASMKNVQQSVLRAMASKRKFMKQYSVIRALASNPRMPLDVALTLIPHLLVNDLNALSNNKNVSDTLRKLALKLYKEKTSSRKG